ncbi:MAG TPA: hypothetical protein VHU86_05445 [Solirubrobacterales bacterium]|nr:hypothetical protein [Solirubrobacterales bacterium]
MTIAGSAEWRPSSEIAEVQRRKTSDQSGMVAPMLDHEKPRRPRSDEEAEIIDLIQERQARADNEMFRIPDESLATQVAKLEADEEARLEARDRAETPEEREHTGRLLREEGETQAEAPLLHAKERKRQAAVAARRAASSEYSRQAS